ncbi:hypothetical protein LV457_09960 [Mycobacterium sp. MYCO198283]|uniref:hypothetical protein n=1 Tax=Mycobacterium sp. MYCO198283 TaxID=2883505 RepID=UPI001E30C283|nr:hypothetical protein [Mycobacterium sp. MYCO198283]MCG5432610.1 hypothetical protein [Mycobacterium sp. MYCO198283]
MLYFRVFWPESGVHNLISDFRDVNAPILRETRIVNGPPAAQRMTQRCQHLRYTRVAVVTGSISGLHAVFPSQRKAQGHNRYFTRRGIRQYRADVITVEGRRITAFDVIELNGAEPAPCDLSERFANAIGVRTRHDRSREHSGHRFVIDNVVPVVGPAERPIVQDACMPDGDD